MGEEGVEREMAAPPASKPAATETNGKSSMEGEGARANESFAVHVNNQSVSFNFFPSLVRKDVCVD